MIIVFLTIDWAKGLSFQYVGQSGQLWNLISETSATWG
jgi:hypothetical protein